jgi:outer membrane protein OmpA-like peptidoglycan-associated protein
MPVTQLQIFGKLHPALMGSGEAVWSKNRRDEFKVFKPKY